MLVQKAALDRMKRTSKAAVSHSPLIQASTAAMSAGNASTMIQQPFDHYGTDRD
jgi:hypothetical protein